MSRAGYIYALVENNSIKYVGQAKDLTKRYAQHCSLAQNVGKTRKQRWLYEIIKDGNLPAVVSLEATEDMDSAEVRWISFFRDNGVELFNTADGGKTMTYLHRAKQTKPWGKRHSPLQHYLIGLKQDMAFAVRHDLPEFEQKSRARYENTLDIIKRVGRDKLNVAIWQKHGVKWYGQ